MFHEIATMVLLTQDRKASTEMDNFCEAQSHCVRIEFSQFHSRPPCLKAKPTCPPRLSSRCRTGAGQVEAEKPQNPYNPVYSV